MWKVGLYNDSRWDLIAIPDDKRCEWNCCGGIKVFLLNNRQEYTICFVGSVAFVLWDNLRNKLWALEDYERDIREKGTSSFIVKRKVSQKYIKNNYPNLTFIEVAFINDEGYTYIRLDSDKVSQIDCDEILNCIGESMCWLIDIKNNYIAYNDNYKIVE